MFDTVAPPPSPPPPSNASHLLVVQSARHLTLSLVGVFLTIPINSQVISEREEHVNRRGVGAGKGEGGQAFDLGASPPSSSRARGDSAELLHSALHITSELRAARQA